MKNKNTVVQSLVKVFRIFTQIGFVACIVGASICAIGLICALIWGDNPQVTEWIFDLGINANRDTMICYSLCGFVETLAFVYLMYLSTKMFKHELELGTPYDEDLAKEMQKTGVIYALLSLIVSFVISIILELFKVQVDFSNGVSIMLGLVYFVVGCILDYGCDVIKNAKEPTLEQQTAGQDNISTQEQNQEPNEQSLQNTSKENE